MPSIFSPRLVDCCLGPDRDCARRGGHCGCRACSLHEGEGVTPVSPDGGLIAFCLRIEGFTQIEGFTHHPPPVIGVNWGGLLFFFDFF